ncbi:hypothetical protein AVEN_64708-1 [Araneus ventricosus]|uniref:Uncharacterized protein n=1 Tax=Araneus ventricosus TaxID=182803 RepID=A0A4Y2N0M5_ARAVE|nr:hypothetical protein AVEN_196588-1 [Araneus ventricosus]GBN32140.1 hypothetical protein AVEN_64708-1 [Araneus ventricosus]
MTATKLIKIQKSHENLINPSHSRVQIVKANNTNQWQPRNVWPHNFTHRQNFRSNNFQPNPSPRQNFRSFHNANAYFQNKLPPSPCWHCTNQGVANAYHWVQTCPFRLSAGQLPSPNPAPPNFDPPKEENTQ